jgi:hypothetical protein
MPWLRELPEIAKAFDTWKKQWDGTGDLDAYLAERLGKAIAIHDAMDEVYRKQERFNKERDKQWNAISQKARDIRQRCDHSLTKYHPDPSGNSDSSYECLICGHDDVRSAKMARATVKVK